MTAPRSDVVVVIPMPNDPDWTIFEHIDDDVSIIVPDDSDGKLAPPPRDHVRYFDFSAQREVMGEHWEAIPHRSAACRNFGHALAYREGFETIIALDYDCKVPPGWLADHLAALRTGSFPAKKPVVDGGWINPINAPGFYARGYPYELRNPVDSAVDDATADGEVKLHIGVWEKIVDLNGIDRYGHEAPYDPGLYADEPVVALAPTPVCGMNTSFRREVTPGYFFLPDLWVQDGSPGGWQLSRHDDIWGGYVVKRLMDKRGDLVSFGGPIVEHTRLTPGEKTTKIEHYMHLMAWGFFEMADAAAARISTEDYAPMFAAFADEFVAEASRRTAPRHYREVYLALGDWMQRWAKIYTS
jgi:Reversibly glycosylated polypeptide